LPATGCIAGHELARWPRLLPAATRLPATTL
jgi:hypothetical protein